MTTNGSVTIWHWNEETEEYTPIVFYDAHIYNETRTDASDGGFVQGNTCKVRIPTIYPINVTTDDYIYIGVARGSISKSECLKVVAFCDNRESTSPHWRIDAT